MNSITLSKQFVIAFRAVYRGTKTAAIAKIQVSLIAIFKIIYILIFLFYSEETEKKK